MVIGYNIIIMVIYYNRDYNGNFKLSFFGENYRPIIFVQTYWLEFYFDKNVESLFEFIKSFESFESDLYKTIIFLRIIK